MLPQLTYEEVDDYFNVLQAPTLTSDIADDVLSLPSPPPASVAHDAVMTSSASAVTAAAHSAVKSQKVLRN